VSLLNRVCNKALYEFFVPIKRQNPAKLPCICHFPCTNHEDQKSSIPRGMPLLLLPYWEFKLHQQIRGLYVRKKLWSAYVCTYRRHIIPRRLPTPQLKRLMISSQREYLCPLFSIKYTSLRADYATQLALFINYIEWHLTERVHDGVHAELIYVASHRVSQTISRRHLLKLYYHVKRHKRSHL
jgi:hypothetical protein